MDPTIEDLLRRRFARPAPAEDKRATLAQAVERHVRPGDALHLGLTHVRGCVALWEILRRFHGTDPGFTLMGVQLTTPATPLVHAGLARRLVTSWAGDSYYTPGPSPVYQRAWKAGLPIENWSILTFVQRLAAGARGEAWTTTRSLAGSDLARENPYREVEAGLGLIPALVPDVSIFHAAAADAQGNVLMTPPYMENAYGALAARRGAIVTVDRIVSTEELREHSAFTRIPSSRVLAVVEAPFGGHPGGLFARGIAGVDAYGEDYEFWASLRAAEKDPAAMDAWIKEWVLEPGSHEAYLARLGEARLDGLRERAREGTWRAELEAALAGQDLDRPANGIERAVVAAARTLAGRIRTERYSHMLAGAGMANLAAWLSAFSLADEGVAVDLVAEMGLIGYWPSPGEPFLFNQRNFPACTMLADIDWTLSIVMGGGQARSIGSLGAAEVDKHGNINSTMTEERFLMGSGGANDVATCATETVVTAPQVASRLRERVAYVTAPGDRVRTLVTTAGLYEKDEEGELVLTAVFGEDVQAAAREARETCGWALRVARTLRRLEEPSAEELRTLRLMDPHGYFLR